MHPFSPTLSQGHCEVALVKTQSFICYDRKIPVAWLSNNSVAFFRMLSDRCPHWKEDSGAN